MSNPLDPFLPLLGHLLRNKSIIVDLFHGQLKSKVTCRVCWPSDMQGVLA